MRAARPIVIRRAPGQTAHRAIMAFHHRVYSCAIGRNGVTALKREGDRATPAGRMRIVAGYHSTHPTARLGKPSWTIPISSGLGWCDDSSNPNYNRPVRLPFAASHETMARNDGLYDICLVLDWNLAPRARFRGSAIFFHCATPDHAPTEGCIALRRPDMGRILPYLRRGLQILVMP